MNPESVSFSILCVLTLVFSTARAQERAPHGLAYENPIAFSPAAVDFFHPKTQCADSSSSSSSACSPLPLAAQIDENEAQENLLSTSRKGGKGLGAGGIAAIVLGLTFVVVVAMAGFYVFISRRANVDRSNFIKPHDSNA